MTNYTGLYVQRLTDGTIYNVQVRDSNGHEFGLSPQEYEARNISPPVNQLPAK